MPDDPRSSTAVDGRSGRLLVAEGDIEVFFTASITTHDVGTGTGTGELVLERSGDVASAPELSAAIEELRRVPPYADVVFRLVADRRTPELDPLPEAVADAVGLPHRRELLQMRRPLPLEADHPERRRAPAVTLRPIDLHATGDDDATSAGSWPPDMGAWLRVNNRAFVDHPDQGTETAHTFLGRLDGEYEDPSGFLLADDTERPGELSGFCWTKIHLATADDPVLGEIYVIGVDPANHGEGLGTAYVLAGLDQLAAAGASTAMLYVEADNQPARRLYDRLGFSTYLRRRIYTAEPS